MHNNYKVMIIEKRISVCVKTKIIIRYSYESGQNGH